MPQSAVTYMDEKGRLTMPENLMKGMCLKTPAKVAARPEGDVVTMTFEAATPESAWLDLFEKMDKRGIRMSEDEVVAEIHAYRKRSGMDAWRAECFHDN